MSDSDEFDEFDEFDELINRCQNIEKHITESLQSLHTIHNLTNVKTDFDEILNKLHSDALYNIKTTGKNTFGQQLLEVMHVKEK